MTTVPPDYTTPTGQVRLLIADTSSLEADRLFFDEQIDAFLAINAGNVRRAAADALDAIATSEVLVSKKIRTQDLATDGPAVAAELRKQAVSLRERADAEDDDFAFEIVAPNTGATRPELTEYDQVWGL